MRTDVPPPPLQLGEHFLHGLPVVAADVAGAMTRTGQSPTFVDMNAIAPTTARRIAKTVGAAGADYIDGGIIGWAPGKSDSDTRLYVSGPNASLLDQLDGNGKRIIQLGDEIGRASAVKMVYASVTKGTDSLLTAAYTASEALGIRDIMAVSYTHLPLPTILLV